MPLSRVTLPNNTYRLLYTIKHILDDKKKHRKNIYLHRLMVSPKYISFLNGFLHFGYISADIYFIINKYIPILVLEQVWKDTGQYY